MDERICNERNTSVIEKIKLNERRLNNHGERIDRLEVGHGEFKIQIINLCDSLKDLTKTLHWLIALIVTSLLAFFFFIIQNIVV